MAYDQRLADAERLLRRVYEECASGRIPPVELDADLEDEIADFLGEPRPEGFSFGRITRAFDAHGKLIASVDHNGPED